MRTYRIATPHAQHTLTVTRSGQTYLDRHPIARDAAASVLAAVRGDERYTVEVTTAHYA